MCIHPRFDDQKGQYIDVSYSQTPQEKSINLSTKPKSRQFATRLFSLLPYTIFVPQAPDWALVALQLTKDQSIASKMPGTDGTVVITRFTRYRWEVLDYKRWRGYSKGGGFKRWSGLDQWVIDWRTEGEEIEKYALSRYPPEKLRLVIKDKHLVGKGGITYTSFANRNLCGREFACGYVASNRGPCFTTADSKLQLTCLSFLNSRVANMLARCTCPSTEFGFKYIGGIPLPKSVEKDDTIQRLTEHIVQISRTIDSYDLIEKNFSKTFLESTQKPTVNRLKALYEEGSSFIENVWAIIHTLEGINDQQITSKFNIINDDLLELLEQSGKPAGWYPIIEGYDNVPKIQIPEIPMEVIEYLEKHERIKPLEEELAKIKSCLCALYMGGPGTKVEDLFNEEENVADSDEEEEVESIIGKKIPIPTETFLEELSVKMEIHPISIYWLLKEMREKEGLVCWPECKRYVEDYFTIIVLRMLGFRWPRQVEAGEPLPEWADKDGIIPITEHTEEKTLLERIRDRIGVEFGEDKIADIESEFADILYNAACKEAETKGKKPPKKKMTLAQWLEKEFFKAHTSQFKKRPIAWQLTSSNGTFKVLIFCHKISLDMFKNLKNRHLAKVQSYYGSLLERARRGESIPTGLTVGKLSDIELELEEFSNKLDKIITMPYEPLIDDGVRVNIAPLQKLGLLASPVLAAKDVDRAIADRNRWREDDKEQTTIWKLS